MVGGLPVTPAVFGPDSITHQTEFENLFLVGDTAFPGPGLAAVSHSAMALADRLTGK